MTGNALLLRTRVGLRIHGGRSRALDQKSLRLYFDHGDGPVTLDLFAGDVLKWILENKRDTVCQALVRKYGWTSGHYSVDLVEGYRFAEDLHEESG